MSPEIKERMLQGWLILNEKIDREILMAILKGYTCEQISIIDRSGWDTPTLFVFRASVMVDGQPVHEVRHEPPAT